MVKQMHVLILTGTLISASNEENIHVYMDI